MNDALFLCLVKHLHSALGGFLAEVSGKVTLVDLPVVKAAAVVVAPAPAAAPVPEVKTEPEVVAKAEPEPPAQASGVQTPTPEQVRDPAFPRVNLISFLATRGYPAAEAAAKPLEEIQRLCLEQLEAMASLGPGVKTRAPRGSKKKAEPAPAAAPSTDPAAELVAALSALSEADFGFLSRTYELNGERAEVTSTLVDILENVVALRESLALRAEVEAEALPAAQVEPQPAAVAAAAAIAEPVVDPVPEAPPVAPIATGAELLARATALHGWDGTLYGYLVNAKLPPEVPKMEKSLQEYARRPEFAAPFAWLANELGCKFNCTTCPRGGGQVAVCATLTDSEVQDPPALLSVLNQQFMVKIRPTGLAIDDSAAGEAAVEEVRG